MTADEAVKIFDISRECIRRKTETNCTDCLHCDLLRTNDEIFSALDFTEKAIMTMERLKRRSRPQ